METWQDHFLESHFCNFHQQRVHGMSAWAERFAAGLDQGPKVLLELQLDDLRADASREHQDLIGRQCAEGLLEFGVGLHDAAEPAASALSRRELFVGKAFGFYAFALFSAFVKLLNEGSDSRVFCGFRLRGGDGVGGRDRVDRR